MFNFEVKCAFTLFSEYVLECKRALVQLDYQNVSLKTQIAEKDSQIKKANSKIEEKEKELSSLKITNKPKTEEVVVIEKQIITTVVEESQQSQQLNVIEKEVKYEKQNENVVVNTHKLDQKC